LNFPTIIYVDDSSDKVYDWNIEMLRKRK